jgi:hypothetical protein
MHAILLFCIFFWVLLTFFFLLFSFIHFFTYSLIHMCIMQYTHSKKKILDVIFGVKLNVLADTFEHVPLLVTASQQKQKPSCIMKSNKVTNGNGLIDNSSEQSQQILQSQISPAMLSSNSSAHVMRARLNQYRTNNVIVNFNEKGTETTVGKGVQNKKKKSADI